MQLIDLLMQVRNLEFGLQVDLIVDVGADMVLGRLAVLAEQHDHRQEDRLKRDAHRQQAERKRIESRQARDRIEADPDQEPDGMEAEKRQAAAEGGDGAA